MIQRLARVMLAATTVVAMLPSCANLDGLAGGSPSCGNHVVDPGEACDGDACCTPTCTLAAAGTACRPAADLCDVAEACSGTSAACPADAFAPAGTVCRAATAACDVAEACSGNAAACPADVTSCAGGVCRPGKPCMPADTCTATDELGCNVQCACADEGVYSCSNSCCPAPAVAGKTCTPSTLACDDACNQACTCTGGVWSCAGTCKACPESAPTNGDTAYADIGASCSYLTDPVASLRTCTGRLHDATSNEWSCTASAICTDVAVDGKACAANDACGDACGRVCTCTSAGVWSCPPGPCNACPNVDETPLDSLPCTSSAGTVCTYVASDPTSPAPITRCVCSGGKWGCTSEAACPPSDALPIAGSACASTEGTMCNYELTSCTCTNGTWSCQ